jgi:hypothetical protein
LPRVRPLTDREREDSRLIFIQAGWGDVAATKVLAFETLHLPCFPMLITSKLAVTQGDRASGADGPADRTAGSS